MKFSIIIATLDRPDCLKNCIDSIFNQKYKNYEIIIIDQSDNLLTKNIINDYKKNAQNLSIVYKKNLRKGLSLARNEGIKISTGEFICFLDDDAEYRDDFLQRAYEILIENKDIVILSGKILDKKTKIPFLSGMNDNNFKRLNSKNLFTKFSSSSLIISMNVIKSEHGFDENLGVGSKFGSAEESDLILRINYIDNNIFYFSTLIVYHPYVDTREIGSTKAFNYGKGLGALCKKHVFKYNNHELMKTFIISVIRNFGGIVIYAFINRNKMKHSYSVLKGRVQGFVEYKITKNK